MQPTLFLRMHHKEKWTAARPPSSGGSSSLTNHELKRRNISSAPHPASQMSAHERCKRPSTSSVSTWRNHFHEAIPDRENDSEKGRVSTCSYHSIPCRRRHRREDPIEKARRITRSAPDIPVRWRRSYPSKVECKMVVAEMASTPTPQIPKQKISPSFSMAGHFLKLRPKTT
ncbi:hypothetical protein BSKO_03955 [Bryopsis sp. KO-2023]|nr:hypothetical protein BSKO_03955 [Bryopsis sp. KO-2023]